MGRFRIVREGVARDREALVRQPRVEPRVVESVETAEGFGSRIAVEDQVIDVAFRTAGSGIEAIRVPET